MWESARTRENTRKHVRKWEHAGTHENTREHKRLWEKTRKYTRTHENMRKHEKIRVNTQEHARTLENMREHLRTCENIQEHPGTPTPTCAVGGEEIKKKQECLNWIYRSCPPVICKTKFLRNYLPTNYAILNCRSLHIVAICYTKFGSREIDYTFWLHTYMVVHGIQQPGNV